MIDLISQINKIAMKSGLWHVEISCEAGDLHQQSREPMWPIITQPQLLQHQAVHQFTFFFFFFLQASSRYKNNVFFLDYNLVTLQDRKSNGMRRKMLVTWQHKLTTINLCRLSDRKQRNGTDFLEINFCVRNLHSPVQQLGSLNIHKVNR